MSLHGEPIPKKPERSHVWLPAKPHPTNAVESIMIGILRGAMEEPLKIQRPPIQIIMSMICRPLLVSLFWRDQLNFIVYRS